MPDSLLTFDKSREEYGQVGDGVYTTQYDPTLGCQFDTHEDLKRYVAKSVLRMETFFKQEREYYTEYDWLSRSNVRKSRWVRVKQDLSFLMLKEAGPEKFTNEQLLQLSFLRDNYFYVETKAQALDYLLKLKEYEQTYWDFENNKAVCYSGAFDGRTLASLTFDELIQYYRQYALSWNTTTDSGTRLYVSIPYQAPIAQDVMMEFIRRKTELENRLIALAEEGFLKQLGRDAFFVLRFIESTLGQLGVFGKILQAASLLVGFPSVAAAIAKAVSAVTDVMKPVFIINKGIAIKDMVSDGDIGKALVGISDFTSGDAAFILKNGGWALQNDQDAIFRLLEYAADRVGVGMTTEDIEKEVRGWVEGIGLPTNIDWDLGISIPSIHLPDITPEFDFDFLDFGSMKIGDFNFALPELPELRLGDNPFKNLTNFIGGLDFIRLPRLQQVTFLNVLRETYKGKGIDMSWLDKIDDYMNQAGDAIEGAVETVDDLFDLVGSETSISDDYTETRNNIVEGVRGVVEQGTNIATDAATQRIGQRIVSWLPMILIGGLIILNLPIGKKKRS